MRYLIVVLVVLAVSIPAFAGDWSITINSGGQPCWGGGSYHGGGYYNGGGCNQQQYRCGDCGRVYSGSHRCRGPQYTCSVCRSTYYGPICPVKHRVHPRYDNGGWNNGCNNGSYGNNWGNQLPPWHPNPNQTYMTPRGAVGHTMDGRPFRYRVDWNAPY